MFGGIAQASDTFHAYCSWWRLDPDGAERPLRQRLGGSVVVDAPWLEHALEMIRAMVR